MLRGTVIAQFIGVIGSLVLAKLYGAEDFGLFGTYLSIVSIIHVVYTLQLDYGIVIIPDKKESDNLLSSILGFSFFFGLIAFLFFIFFSNVFDSYFFPFALCTLSLLSSVLLAQNKTFEAYLTKYKNFKLLANAKIITSISTIFFQFILFYFYRTNGLIIGSVIAFLLTFFYYFNANYKNIIRPNSALLKKSVKENISLLQFLLPSNLTNALSINAMPILILYFFNEAEAGAYFLSIKILMSPLLLISASISQVYFQKSNELYLQSKNKLFDFTKKIVLSNILLMTAILILINTLGLLALSYFFNQNWDNLIPFTLILSFLALARSSFSPISHIILVTDKNHIGFIFNIYFLIINLLSIYIGYSYQNIIYCVSLLSIFSGIGYLLLLTYFMLLLNKMKKEMA